MLDKARITVTTTSDARKDKIGSEKAWEILLKASTIYIGRGQKYLELVPSITTKDDILKNSLGRSENLRAPTLIIDTKIIVGFNDELYNSFFG